MNVLGVILAILLLMLFVYKRINLILATLLGVFILSLSNKIPFYNLLYNSYSIALANFLAKYFWFLLQMHYLERLWKKRC